MRRLRRNARQRRNEREFSRALRTASPSMQQELDAALMRHLGR